MAPFSENREYHLTTVALERGDALRAAADVTDTYSIRLDWAEFGAGPIIGNYAAMVAYGYCLDNTATGDE